MKFGKDIKGSAGPAGAASGEQLHLDKVQREAKMELKVAAEAWMMD